MDLNPCQSEEFILHRTKDVIGLVLLALLYTSPTLETILLLNINAEIS